MNWEKINEYLNLIAMFSAAFPLLYGIRKWYYSTVAKLLIFYFAFGLVLDSMTFYIYKFLDQNSYWSAPLYYFNYFFILSWILYLLLKNHIFSKYLVYLIAAGFTFLSSRLIFFNNINTYDNIAYFSIQLYFVLVCLIIFFIQSQKTKIKIFNSPLTLISAGIFLNCLLPLISNLLQYNLYETSPVYFQIALIILNLSAIVANIFFFFAFKHITPTSTPKPSQLPREPN